MNQKSESKRNPIKNAMIRFAKTTNPNPIPKSKTTFTKIIFVIYIPSYTLKGNILGEIKKKLRVPKKPFRHSQCETPCVSLATTHLKKRWL